MTSPHQYALPLPHNERLSAEDFMITESNRDAASWIDAWPEWPGTCLVLYGPAGSGKTHLVEVWRTKSNARAFDRDQDDRDHRHFFLDNADHWMGQSDLEEKLFHLFNRLKEEKGSLLVTGLLPPSQWPIRLPDLRSRLVASTATALQSPDDTLVAALLIKQFGDRQLQVEAGVIDYLTPRVERSPAFIRALVERLDQASLATRKGITTALARDVLSETQPSS